MQTNAILAGLAVVLAIPTAVTLIAERRSFTEYDSIPRLFEGFTPENVQAIVLTKAKAASDPAAAQPPEGSPEPAPVEQDELVLIRQEGKWVIGETQERPHDQAGVPVRANKVEDDVLEHVKQMRRDDKALVKVDADDKELAAKGLTEATGTLVRCQNADRVAVAEFWLGKDASGGQYGQDAVKGYFVCPKGRKDIILYEPDYWNLTLKAEDWIETRIQQFEADRVTGLAIRNPSKGDVAFTREPKKEGEPNATRIWKADKTPEGRGTLRQEEINGLLSRFAYVNVQRYVGHVGRLSDPELQRMVPGPESSQIEVKATLDDGATATMWVGTKVPDKPEYYALFAGKDAWTKDYLVAVGDWMVTGFEKDPAELFEPAAPTPAAPVTPAVPKEGEGGAQKPPETPKQETPQETPKQEAPKQEEPKVESSTTPPKGEGGAEAPKTGEPGGKQG